MKENPYGFRWQVGLLVTTLIILPFMFAATVGSWIRDRRRP